MKHHLDMQHHRQRRREYLRDNDSDAYKKEIQAFMAVEMSGHNLILEGVCSALSLTPKAYAALLVKYEASISKSLALLYFLWFD